MPYPQSSRHTPCAVSDSILAAIEPTPTRSASEGQQHPSLALRVGIGFPAACLRRPLCCIAALLLVTVLTTISLSQAQDRPSPLPPPGQKPPPSPSPQRPTRDLSKMSPFDRQVFLSAQRGSEWLQRANGGDGRFVPGYVPALRVPLESDSFLHQAGAALALGKAAAYFQDDRAAAIARQAVLTLLEDTAEDRQQPGARVCTWPGGVLDQLEAAAITVRAVCAVPAPAADVLDKADQLCIAIYRSQKADGSLSVAPPVASADLRIPLKAQAEAVQARGGEALAALMQSQQLRPAPWKIEAVRKALPYYQASWRAEKNLVIVPSCTPRHLPRSLSGDLAQGFCRFRLRDERLAVHLPGAATRSTPCPLGWRVHGMRRWQTDACAAYHCFSGLCGKPGRGLTCGSPGRRCCALGTLPGRSGTLFAVLDDAAVYGSQFAALYRLVSSDHPGRVPRILQRWQHSVGNHAAAGLRDDCVLAARREDAVSRNRAEKTSEVLKTSEVFRMPPS